MKKILIFTLLCVVFLAVAESSFAGKNIRYRNAKTIGMGDAKVAGGFGYNGFIDNPALLSRVGVVRFSIVNLPITINKNLLDIGEFISDNTDKFQDYDELTIDEKNEFIDYLEEHDSKWGRANVSPMIDIALNIRDYGIGFAVFNNADLGVKIDRGIYEPRVWGEGINNTVYVLGIAKPLMFLYPGLTVGVNLKCIQRRRAKLFQIPASNLGDFAETVDPIIDEVTSKHSTFAVDIGTLWELPFIKADLAATLQSIGDGRGSSVDIGFAKRMYNDNFIFLVDYIDFFDNNKENIFNKFHIGAEHNMKPLVLRAGINSGYPAIGLGLNSRVFDIDFAYYGKELTKGPGGDEETRYMVQIKLGW